MFTHTPGRAKSTFLITAWILAAIIALIGSGLDRNRPRSGSSNDSIPSITLDSQQPGQLVVNWQAPASPADRLPDPVGERRPERVPVLDSAANEAEQRANEYPRSADATTHHDQRPDAGRQLQGPGAGPATTTQNRTVHQSSGPWTNLA